MRTSPNLTNTVSPAAIGLIPDDQQLLGVLEASTHVDEPLHFLCVIDLIHAASIQKNSLTRTAKKQDRDIADQPQRQAPSSLKGGFCAETLHSGKTWQQVIREKYHSDTSHKVSNEHSSNPVVIYKQGPYFGPRGCLPTMRNEFADLCHGLAVPKMITMTPSQGPSSTLDHTICWRCPQEPFICQFDL